MLQVDMTLKLQVKIKRPEFTLEYLPLANQILVYFIELKVDKHRSDAREYVISATIKIAK